MEVIGHVCSTMYSTVASEPEEEAVPGWNLGLKLDMENRELHFTLPGITTLRRYCTISESMLT